MKFTKLQLASIYKLAFLMTAADGVIKENEKNLLVRWMTKLTVDSNCNADSVIAFANDMQYEDTVPVILPMSNEQKDIVAAVIGSIMLIDDNIDTKEKNLFDTVCKMCGLPIMTRSQCYDIFGK